MDSIYECNGKFFLLKLLQPLFFVFATFPQKTKIPADKKHIVFLQLSSGCIQPG